MRRSIPLFSELNQYPLTQGLPEHELERLCSESFIKEFEDGEFVFFEGDECEFGLMVLRGGLKGVKSSSDGKQQVLIRAGISAVLNLELCLSEGPTLCPYDIKTAGPSRVLFIPKSEISRLLKVSEHFNQFLLKELASQKTWLLRLAGDLSLLSVRARLAGFLIQRADAQEHFSNLTQTQIAAEIGTVREVVARLLREFEEKGYLKRVGNQIRLRNREFLVRVAKDIKEKRS